MPAPSPQAQLPAAPEPAPPWADELLDAVQKAARAQARLGLKVEGVDAKVEGGFAEFRAALAAVHRPDSQCPRPDEVLDAMDLLEEACRGPAVSPELEAGLRGIVARLEDFTTRAGLTRIAEISGAPDGRRFRVVGHDCRPELAYGLVSRVVRAAVLEGDRLVREGEVFINGSSDRSGNV